MADARNPALVALRDLTVVDAALIAHWPPYPPDFEGLDQALRNNGWLAEYRQKPGTRLASVAGRLWNRHLRGVRRHDTHMCCDTTARRAFHLGYTVGRLAEAPGTLSLQNTDRTMTDEELYRSILAVQERFSQVMTTEAWINRIQSGTTDGFRTRPQTRGYA